MDRRLFLGALLGVWGLPALASSGRRFRMGVTRWPPEASVEGLALVEDFLRQHCDMAAPMVLGGVPWEAERDEAAYSAALMAELEWKAPKGYPVCLSLGALNIGRDALAPLYAERDNQPVPEDLVNRAFDDPLIIDIYSRFCIKAAQIMQPEWLIIGVEVNLLLHNRPDLWPAYKRLHQATYERVKAALPDQKLGFSVAALHYLGLAQGADAVLQAAEMRDLAQWTDLVGWSVYPHASWDVTMPLPADFFAFIDQMGRDTGKPQAVTESGMTDRRVWIGLLPLWGSPEAQVQVIETMLGAAEQGGWEFVVNWTSHDYPALLEMFPPEVYELGQIWLHTGLANPDGSGKPALATWDAALARPYGR